jgi:hypothetical protein
MEAKVVDVLSVGGVRAMLAINLGEAEDEERRIAEREGFGDGHLIFVTLGRRPLSATYDSFDWVNGGEGHVTKDWPLQAAHNKIAEQWNKLESGDLIDVRDAPNPHL